MFAILSTIGSNASDAAMCKGGRDYFKTVYNKTYRYVNQDNVKLDISQVTSNSLSRYYYAQIIIAKQYKTSQDVEKIYVSYDDGYGSNYKMETYDYLQYIAKNNKYSKRAIAYLAELEAMLKLDSAVAKECVDGVGYIIQRQKIVKFIADIKLALKRDISLYAQRQTEQDLKKKHEVSNAKAFADKYNKEK